MDGKSSTARQKVFTIAELLSTPGLENRIVEVEGKVFDLTAEGNGFFVGEDNSYVPFRLSSMILSPGSIAPTDMQKGSTVRIKACANSTYMNGHAKLGKYHYRLLVLEMKKVDEQQPRTRDSKVKPDTQAAGYEKADTPYEGQ